MNYADSSLGWIDAAAGIQFASDIDIRVNMVPGSVKIEMNAKCLKCITNLLHKL